MPKRLCKANTKKGAPCPTGTWGTSEYCIGHDPDISQEMRDRWIKQSCSKHIRPKHPDYRLMTPSAIIEYVSEKIALLQEKWGETPEAQTYIADYLRVAIQAHRIMQSKHELRKQSQKTDSGPRTVRIVRDEPQDDPRVADAS